MANKGWSSGDDAIVTIDELRHRRQLSAIFEINAAIPLMSAAFINFFCEMGFKALQIMANHTVFFQPAADLIIPVDWVEDITAKPRIAADMDKAGKIFFARYRSGEDQRFSDKENGERIFTLNVSPNKKIAVFFHGDAIEENGTMLELEKHADGQYRATTLCLIEKGMPIQYLPRTQDYIEDFLLQLVPAMNKQGRQAFATPVPSHLRLVK